MAQFGQGYVGTSSDAAAGESLKKKREQLFANSEEEKRKLTQETAAYRLKGESERFSSTSNSTEVQLTQATVGLVTKEEWARRRREAEEGPPAEVAPPPSFKEKKKKKKAGGGLSFAFDEDEEGGGDAEAAAPPKKKPKKPSDDESAAPASTTAAVVSAEAADGSGSTPPAAAAVKETLPAGHTCIRSVSGGFLQIHTECRVHATLPRNRVVAVGAQTISLDIKAVDRGGGEEANAALCGFLRSVLGGASVSAEVVTGHRAPLKLVKVGGVATADEAYHRLLIASKIGKAS